ncbi:MAG: CPBP family glutamic-type intramembrane protease, partial [Myxococcota bacterium]
MTDALSKPTSTEPKDGDEEQEQLGPVRTYLRDSRNLLNSLILVVPLFVIYQVGILTTDGVQNGVDFITGFLRFTLFGGDPIHYLLFNLGVLAALGVTIAVLSRTQRFNPKTFLFVVLEGTLYGLLLGGIISSVLVNIGIRPSLSTLTALNTAESMGILDNFVLSIGAGLYEELVFRLILLGGSVWVMTQALKLPEWPSIIGAILVTSLMFSAIHYVGNMADAFEFYSFMFRFLA